MRLVSVNWKVVGTSCIFDFARVTAKQPACKMDFAHSVPNHVAKLLNKRKANIRNSITFTKLDSCEVSVVIQNGAIFAPRDLHPENAFARFQFARCPNHFPIHTSVHCIHMQKE